MNAFEDRLASDSVIRRCRLDVRFDLKLTRLCYLLVHSLCSMSLAPRFCDRWKGSAKRSLKPTETARIIDPASLTSSKELTSFSSTTYDSCSDCRIRSSLYSGRCGRFRLQKIRRDKSQTPTRTGCTRRAVCPWRCCYMGGCAHPCR